MSFKYEASAFALTLDGPVILNGGTKSADAEDEGWKRQPKVTTASQARDGQASVVQNSSQIDENGIVELLHDDDAQEVKVKEAVEAAGNEMQEDEEHVAEDDCVKDSLAFGEFVEFTEDLLAAPVPQHTPAQTSDPTAYDPNYQPPWVHMFRNIQSPMLRLHNEIVELCKMLEATAEEAAIRQQCVDDVAEVVNTIWPGATTEVFGSFATGLYVPTSDIDLVVMGAPASNVQDALKALANALVRKGVAKNMQVIGKARVPIIKFEGAETGIKFDISFNVPSGPQGASLVKKMLATWPPMKPLVLMLKVFLQQRELNEVYMGGLGSYSLITLVASFLQLHLSRQSSTGHRSKRQKTGTDAEKKAGNLEGGLGVLFVDLLRTYGRIINTQKVGISCRNGGFYFRKSDRPDWVNYERPYLMAIEDPADQDNDIGRNSFNIMKVRAAFDWAYQLLVAPCPPHESLLARVLHLKPVLAGRGRPTWPQPYPKVRPPLRDSYRTPTPSKPGKQLQKRAGKRLQEQERDSDCHTRPASDARSLEGPWSGGGATADHMSGGQGQSPLSQPHRVLPLSSPPQGHPWRGMGTPFACQAPALRSPPAFVGLTPVPMQWRSPTPPATSSRGQPSNGVPSGAYSHTVPAPYSIAPSVHGNRGLDAVPRSRSAPPARPGDRGPGGVAGYNHRGGGYHSYKSATGGSASANGAGGGGAHYSQNRHVSDPPRWAQGQGHRVHTSQGGRGNKERGYKDSGRTNTHIRFDD